MFGTLWCAFAVFAAAANSRQLYGLRARIREIGKLGQYTLEAKIGEGGMGAVYRATHAMLRRPAAIKLLTKDGASEKDLARFEREVQLTSTLSHPNTVAVFDYGRTADGVFYYVMEYLDGWDLDRLVKEHGPLPPARVIHILAQACGALVEAHALQLIHRDIKPANIVLTGRVDEPDVVKVVDFGLVKTLATNASESRSDAIKGTPMYLAPEAVRAPDAVDARTDIYSLGAVAYFLLSGREVFSGETVLEVLSRHLLEEPLPPSTHLAKPLPTDLEQLVLQCLAKDPGGRPQSAASLRAPLLAARTHPATIGAQHLPGGSRTGGSCTRAPRVQPRAPPQPWPSTSAGGRPPPERGALTSGAGAEPTSTYEGEATPARVLLRRKALGGQADQYVQLAGLGLYLRFPCATDRADPIRPR